MTTKSGGGNNKREFTEALGGEKCWLLRACEWLGEKSGAEIEYINAGIGATPSFLGIHRLQKMVLDKKPDIISIEFSVNDPSAPDLKENEIFECYEALVRKSIESGAAVFLVFMTQETKLSFCEKHSEIGKYYRLPMISYHDAIWNGDESITAWRNTSPDEIHPNNVGHAFLATCIANYFENIWCGNDEEEIKMPDAWLYDDTFYHAGRIFIKDIRSAFDDGFEIMESLPQVSKKWLGIAESKRCGAKAEISIPAGVKKVFISYHNSDAKFDWHFGSGSGAVDTASDKWPKIMWARIYDGESTEKEEKLIIKNLGGDLIIAGIEMDF